MSNNLPSEYQRVEYISKSEISQRSAFIDTLLYPSSIKTMIADISFDRVAQSGGSYLIGGYYPYATSGTTYFSHLVLNSDRRIGIGYANDWIYTNVYWKLGERHIVKTTLEKGNQIILLDGNQIGKWAFGTDRPTINITVPLFTYQYANNRLQNYGWSGKIYSIKLYNDNDKLIRDFIPCYRRSDLEPGLYDFVENKFYTNSGQSNFTAGPEIKTYEEPIKQIEVNWADSMEQTFEYYEVDPITWKDKKPLDMVKTCNISRDDDADTLGSATLDIDNTLGECYIRVYLIINQNGNRFKIVLGTFLVQTPSSSYDGKTRKVLGFALLKNENIMRQAYLIVRDNCRAPVVETTSDKTLQDNFVADPNEKWLSYISDLIAQAKYRLHLDEEGKILFAPIQKVDELQPVFTFNDDNSSILYPEITMQHDLYGIPNVVEVVCSTGVKEYTARVVNDDPNSLTSTVNRGREILYRDTNPNLTGYPTEEQIDEYAKLLLEKLSSVEYQITYTHGYCPVRVGDAVRLNYKRAGLEGVKAKVIKQSIKCENGCSVNETAVFTKKLWN